VNLEPFQALVRDWRAKADEMTDAGDVAPLARVVIEQLLIRADDLEYTIRAAEPNDPAPRHIFPDENDPGALRVELSQQGISARGVALVATDHPNFAGEPAHERPVRIVMTSAQAAELVRRLQAVLDEL
jgi:hypothetical protein